MFWAFFFFFFFLNLISEQFNLFQEQCMLPNALWAFGCECSGD